MPRYLRRVLETTVAFVLLGVAAQAQRRLVRYGAAALVGALIGNTSLRLALRQFSVDRSVRFRQDCEAALAAAYAQIVQQTSLELSDIGLSAFVVQRRVLPPRRRYLGRVARIRLAAVESSNLMWTYDKGVIGRCWHLGQAVFYDTARAYEGYRSPEAWSGAPEDVHLNLSWREKVAMERKYSGVAAVPIRTTGGDIVGVVALDTLVGVDFGRTVAGSESTLRVVADTLFDAARVISLQLDAIPPRTYMR